jgi:hypothetical protein
VRSVHACEELGFCLADAAHHFDVDGIIVLAKEDLDFQVKHLRVAVDDDADVPQYDVLQLTLVAQQGDQRRGHLSQQRLFQSVILNYSQLLDDDLQCHSKKIN